MNYANITEKHLVVYGDSNTYGYDAQNDGRFDSETRYPRLLQKLLGENWLVFEEGLPGRTSVFEDPITEGLSGIQSITPILMSHAPVDVLIIMLGTNDTKVRFGCNADLIARGLRRLVRKALNTECWRDAPKILLVCPPPILPIYRNSVIFDMMGPDCDLKSQKLAEPLEKVAEELHISFLNASEIEGVSMHEFDGMHLSAEAHKKLAEAIVAQTIFQSCSQAT
jgi:lysophospholipase L1-like esterase